MPSKILTTAAALSKPANSVLPESPFFRRTWGFWSLLVRGLTRVFAPRFHVTGRSNIPRGEGVIFTPNHTSDSDPFWMGAAPRFPVWWMAKQEIFSDYPVAGAIMRFVQTYPVDQKSIDRLALDRASEILARREALVIFPEGHTTKDAEIEPLEPGTAMIALKAKVRVVPVGIHGAFHVLPFATLTPRPTLKRVRLHFGPPIDLCDLHEMPKREARKVATQRIEAGMRAALDVARRG
jgi:1-acyl-sn-glycerol-3-phosphate acyltransferase